ncbi:MAG: exonuclease domain-containing protein [Actinomycetaceae bacterium]|nr:exonuclease domain-containing protein [Actinomycetaceae bacterium]
MTTWAKGPFLGFDTETTGVATGSDRIVTVALIERRAGEEDHVRTWMIDPGIDIPEEATRIHGITTEMARTHGAPPEQGLEEVADALVGALSIGTPIVGFNVPFDLDILQSELQRHGLPTLADRLPAGIAPVLDPLVIDRTKARFRKGKRGLAKLINAYALPGRDDFHSAKGDVMATLDLLEAMLQTYPDLLDMNLEEIHAWQVEAHAQWAADMNAWRETKGFDGPPISAGWPLGD